MADDRGALERLCRRFGIATDYHDIWGTRHAAPDANLIALLAAFDVDPESICAGDPNGRFAELMAFQIDRARAYYDSARIGIPALCPSGRFTALASARIYGNILNRIEEQGYDVFAGRAHVPTRRKLGALPTVTVDFLRLYMPIPARAGE